MEMIREFLFHRACRLSSIGDIYGRDLFADFTGKMEKLKVEMIVLLRDLYEKGKSIAAIGASIT